MKGATVSMQSSLMLGEKTSTRISASIKDTLTLHGPMTCKNAHGISMAFSKELSTEPKEQVPASTPWVGKDRNSRDKGEVALGAT